MTDRLPRVAGVLGPSAFIASWVVAGALRDGYDPVHDAISRLAELGAANRWIVTTGMVTFGFSVIVFGRMLPKPAALLALVAGLASLAVAAFPCTEGCPGSGSFTDIAHVIAAATHYVALVGMALLASRTPGARIVVLGAGVALLLHGTGIGSNGALQRLGLTTLDAWMIATATSSRPRERSGTS
jgi:hypothetical membrane protein